MINTYPYIGPGTRWSVEDATAVDFMNLSRQNVDHVYEALNTIMDTDAADGVITGAVTGTLAMHIDAVMSILVAAGLTWTLGWWQSGDGRWWLLVNTADVPTFARADAEFYIPTGDISDVPTS